MTMMKNLTLKQMLTMVMKSDNLIDTEQSQSENSKDTDASEYKNNNNRFKYVLGKDNLTT